MKNRVLISVSISHYQKVKHIPIDKCEYIFAHKNVNVLEVNRNLDLSVSMRWKISMAVGHFK